MSVNFAVLRIMRKAARQIANLFALLCLFAIPECFPADVEEELHIAVERGDTGTVRNLLNAGANPNACFQGIFHPLTIASGDGRLDMARLLVEKGANVNGGCPGGLTPLMMAASHDQVETVRWLLDKGSDVSGRASQKGRGQINNQP